MNLEVHYIIMLILCNMASLKERNDIRSYIFNIRAYEIVCNYSVLVSRVIILSETLGVACKQVSERLGSYGGSRYTFVVMEKSLASASSSPAPCSRYPTCWNARPASPVDRGVGEREQEGVSFKLEIASSVAMMGRKLGAKQNAKERSLERGRDDERRETRRWEGATEQGGTAGCVNERTRIDFFSLFFLFMRLST